jgi:hypothetical protein
MSRGIAGVYGSRYVSIPYLPPPRWISTARGTIRQVLMWIIVFGLGTFGHWALSITGILGYFYTSHIILFIHAPPRQTRAAFWRRLCIEALRLVSVIRMTTAFCTYPYNTTRLRESCRRWRRTNGDQLTEAAPKW